MTNPDPYIEEVMSEFDTWEQKIRNDYRGILSDEQIEATIKYWRNEIPKMTKTQRIKDIEEIKAAIEAEKDTDNDCLHKDSDSCDSNCADQEYIKGGNAALSRIRVILTSRKAAIEEI